MLVLHAAINSSQRYGLHLVKKLIILRCLIFELKYCLLRYPTFLLESTSLVLTVMMRGPFDMSNVGEENGGEAIKLTSTLKNSPDGGASEVLQAVLNSSSNSEESRSTDIRDEEAKAADISEEASTAASVGERFGW